MILLSQSMPSSEAGTAAQLSDEYVCWSRMQAEAGQALEDIVARKERERSVGEGIFFWGVGNAPSAITNALARAGVPVRVIFSIMKTRPKAVDVSPARTVVWRRFIDANGAERPLPAHALITSRGDSAGGIKRAHYALMCRSLRPLELQRGERFDPSAFRNAGGTGAPVGSSQVTALLRRVDEDRGRADYEVNLSAWLTGSYWVRLTDPAELGADRRAMITGIMKLNARCWIDTVTNIRDEQSSREDTARVGLLI